MLQQDALHLLKLGKNIFLTGAAGAGKTFLLNQYIRYLKSHRVSVAITASTGIAATHLQGMTLHAWSGIGIQQSLTRVYLDKLLSNKRMTKRYKSTRVLIIDEISMLHKNHLDMLDSIARYLTGVDAPFGGIQVVLCGDFFQLPPVSENDIVKPFAFASKVWDEANFQVCYLQEQHRQGDDILLTVLNDIRSGTAGEHTKVPLRTRYRKEPLGGSKATRLYSRNINVDYINAQELAKIPGSAKIYTLQSTGFSKLVDSLKKSCLALEILSLKLGAEVMFIKNDLVYNQYANGTRAVVEGFEDSENAWPIVKTYGNKTLTVVPEAWNYEDNGVIRATIMQVPLRLAWALTIHKSQGMTLDAAEIDLGDAFEPGMGYVALSRLRSLTGLKLLNLNEIALQVHPDVLVQDGMFKNNSLQAVSELQAFSAQALEALQYDTLTQRFGGTSEPHTANPKNRSTQAVIPTYMVTLEFLKKTGCIETTALQRSFTLSTIMNHIEKLKSLQLVDANLMSKLSGKIKDKLPTEEGYDLIVHAFGESEDGKLKPIYDKFEGKYTYTDIQMVRLCCNDSRVSGL